MTKPKCVTMGQHRFFNHRKRVAAEAVVDSVPNGSLWFDGFNRVVNDGNNREIDRHSRGNLELISTICRSAKPKQIEGRLFFVGNRGSNNYYHWMLDILPSFDLFSKAGYQISHQDKVVLRNVSSSFQKSTLKKMGITEDQIIEITRETPYFSADELIVPEFQNAMGMSLGAWIPEFLKSTFLREEYKASGKRLYLARGDNAVNGRSLKNESELIAFLKDYGIETIYPDRFSVQQQARLLASAEVVVSAHGAGMTNIVFCQPGTKIVEIYGEYMQTCYWALSAACELDYYNHYCAADCAVPNSTYTDDREIDKLQKQGFSVNCGALKKVFHLAGITQR